MDFIREHIEKKITLDVLKILKKYDSYMLLLNKNINAGYDGSWKIVGVNNFGNPSLPREISVSWSLIRTKELIDIYKQIKSGEYTVQKFRSPW